jgi:archaellum component FlaC
MANSNGGNPLDRIETQIRILVQIIENLQLQIDLGSKDSRELRIRITKLEKEVEALKRQLKSLGGN